MTTATLHVEFRTAHQQSTAGFARLELELPFAPNLDIAFDHPVWHEPRKATAISFNVSDGTFYIALGIDELHSKKEINKHCDMYTLHGWTVTSE